ncbi:tRNA N6-adenosine threonylcarbamoyltransferase [Buchnera aphidicola (Symydobius americanus)]
MRILGIETSFDDTGIAIYDDNIGLIINEVYSQSHIHSVYGGVVPELASREHIYKLVPLIKYVLKKKKIFLNNINAVAYTAGPGLPGSLLVGASIGCALAFACNIPAIPVHHMEGHLLSPMLEKHSPQFPFIALLVSGKHTQLILAHEMSKYELLGETLDDAVGEVFDKIAKALNLGYPGGAVLSTFAKKGISGKFNFPHPMKYHSNFNFSFSGLKTFTLNLIRKNLHNIQSLFDIARGFEDAVINILSHKCDQALKYTGFRQLVIAGGVSSNKNLILHLERMLYKYRGKLFYARPEFCTDNAAMIAYTGMMYFKKYSFKKIDIIVRPKWKITEIHPI